MDGWWEGDHRPAVLTPHAGEFARLRAGSGREPADDGDLVGDDDARVAAAKDAATAWRAVVVLKGARTVIAAADGSVAVAPFENPALATGGTGDVLSGAIGSLLAQGLEPFAAARLGVYLHGVAGDGIRERFGDAGLLASDLPEGLAIARKRLAALAERTGQRETARVCGAGRAGRPWPAALSGAPSPMAHRNRAAGAAPIEARLAAAGLPPFPEPPGSRSISTPLRHNLATLRRLAGPDVPIRPVVKADAYGHGAVPIARALEDAGVDGLCVATFDEAMELRDGGHRRADPGALSDPG